MTRDEIIAKYEITVHPAYVGYSAASDVLGADFFSSGAHGMTEAEAVDVLIEDIEDWLDREGPDASPWVMVVA